MKELGQGKHKARQTLMAIDHPDWLLGVLCAKDQFANLKDFRRELEKLTKFQLSKNSKTDQMYLFMLTSLGFIESRGKNPASYIRTALGDEVCNAHQDKLRVAEYQRILSSQLMQSEYTGRFFGRFLDIARRSYSDGVPLTHEELKGMFKGETHRTLYSLGLESGMIVDNDGFLIPMGMKPTREIDVLSFRQLVDKVYCGIMAKREKTGSRMTAIYVRIAEVRKVVNAILGESEHASFDDRFQKLLAVPEGKGIHIHGAAPQWFPDRGSPEFEDAVFRHKGKIYAFMSIQ